MKNPAHQRQELACGFEPPIATATPWKPPGAYKGPEPKVCAGYTTRLPAVVEGARAAGWRADLRTFAGGEPSEALVHAVEVYDDQRNAADRWGFEQDAKDRERSR